MTRGENDGDDRPVDKYGTMAKETTHVACRLPDSSIAQRDRRVAGMTNELLAVDLTRADIARSVLTRTLDKIERRTAPTTRGER